MLKQGKARRKAASRVAKTGMQPSVAYGVAVTGMATGELDKARSLAFSATAASTAGRSRTLSLMLQPGLDPVIHATLAPVMMLLQAKWEGWIPSHMIEYCLGDERASKWVHVQGPMSAVVVTLRRVGWGIVDEDR